MAQRTSLTKIISDEQGKTLKKILEDRSFNFHAVPYTLFAAQSKNEKISITMFTNGKLLIQGKGLEEFVTFTLEPQVLQQFEFGYEDVAIDYDEKIGIDESGKGDYFGPLVVAGCFVPKGFLKDIAQMGIKDSKEMSDAKILSVTPKVLDSIPFTRISISPKKYNELYFKIKNLNKLLAWGHSRSIENMLEQKPESTVMIDQFADEKVVKRALMQKGKKIKLIQRHKAESDPAVACASIIARYFFLKALEKMAEEFNMNFPKGASTQVQAAAKEFVNKFGASRLPEIAKIHFKTTEIVSPGFQYTPPVKLETPSGNNLPPNI